ncbi:Pvc16 family protein [Rhodocaloribacter sp.]
MSNFLAIATATATLQQLLLESLGVDVPGALATTLRPDNARLSAAGNYGVNIYLYQAAPNAAWRNADLPTRDASGRLSRRPKMALDLHYLLTFYGDEENLQPQRILGSVARTLHARPVLTRAMIQSAIDAAVSVDPGHFLADSDLAGEIERVKFTPIPLSLEELSKLWSVFFQTPYALSMAYLGTVVMIEAEETPSLALPVQTPVIEVAPALPGPPVAPDQLPGLRLWLRSDLGVTYDAEGVSAWADQSGEEHHALQSDADRRPQFTAHGIGTRPVLRFDGADDYLALENFSYDTAGQLSGITVCALVKSSSPDRQIILSFDGSEYWRLALKDGTSVNAGWDTTDETGSTQLLRTAEAYDDGRWHLFCGWYEAGAATPNKRLYVDGESVASVTAHGGNDLGSGVTRFGFLGVGSEADVFDGSRGPSWHFNGDVAEVLVYHRALTDDERLQLEQYFRDRYNSPSTA